MDASGVASLAHDDDICHDTHDGDLNDTFSQLDRLPEDFPEVMERFVLLALNPTALVLLAQVRRGWHAVVVSSGLPCARFTEGALLRVKQFCGTVERLPEGTCALAGRVLGFGFRAKGIGLRIYGQGFLIKGLVFRV